MLWLTVASVQVVLGVTSIISQRKVDVTTAHVAVGALTFMLGWVSAMVSGRLMVWQSASPIQLKPSMAPAQFKTA